MGIFVKDADASGNLQKVSFFHTKTTVTIHRNYFLITTVIKFSKEIFFRLRIFFFSHKKIISKKQLLFSFFMYFKAKKKFRSDSKKFQNSHFSKFTK